MKHQVQGHLLNVIICQSEPIIKLLSGIDQPLLVTRDPLLVVNLGLNIINGI